jgi:hypothetical protein
MVDRAAMEVMPEATGKRPAITNPESTGALIDASRSGCDLLHTHRVKPGIDIL